jgi:hypothetical protein
MSYRKFARDVGFIGAVQVLTSLGNFFLLPIVTKSLGTHYYGLWAQIYITVSLISPLALMGLSMGLIRFLSSETKKEVIKEAVYSILFFVTISGFLASFLLYAFAKVCRQRSGLRLVLIGDGPARATLESLAAELGIAERVAFTGSLPFEEVPCYLKSADMFTFASITETQGLVTIEAMAAGLPIVAVDGSGTRDIVEHGKQGLLVENDAEALAQGIETLLSNPERLKRFKANSLKKSRIFDVNQLGKQLVSVYEQAIQDKKENRYVTLKAEESGGQEVTSSA